MTETPVRQLFADRQPGPAETDINPNFIEMARSVAAICATRALLMIAVLTGAAIWGYTIFDPTQARLYAAIAFSIVFVGPLAALYHRKG
jgi:hypothetical protein